MHVQSRCFANLNLLRFCHSRCRRRLCCLSSNYCGSAGRHNKHKSSAEKIPAHSVLSPDIEVQHPPNHAKLRVSGRAKVQVSR